MKEAATWTAGDTSTWWLSLQTVGVMRILFLVPTLGLFCAPLWSQESNPVRQVTWVEISAGCYHTCGITSDGTAYCWGGDGKGELGTGTTDNSHAPVPVAGNLRFAAISAGQSHTCGITVDGSTYCWGTNSSGELGNGTTERSPMPVPVTGNFRFATISAGNSRTCGLTADGAAYCWGTDPGCGSGKNEESPCRVAGDLHFSSIRQGGLISRACGVTNAGQAFCWGDTPIAASVDMTFATYSPGATHTCGVTPEGAVYCWGTVAKDFKWGPTPTQVSPDLRLGALSSGAMHSCGISEDGRAFCWGNNNQGQLGHGKRSGSLVAEPVSGDLKFSVISAGMLFHTCGVTVEGDAYCWGNNAYGQCGTRVYKNTPVRVADPPGS